MCFDARLVAATGLVIFSTAAYVKAVPSIIIAIIGGTMLASALAAKLIGNGAKIISSAVITVLVASAVAIGQPQISIATVAIYLSLVLVESSLGKTTSRPIEAAAIAYSSCLIAKCAPQAITAIVILLIYAYFSNTVRPEIEEEEKEAIDIASKIASILKST